MNETGYLASMPDPPPSSHAYKDMRSLARHQYLAEILRDMDDPLSIARENINHWRSLVRPGNKEPYSLAAWEAIFDKGVEATIEFMTSDTEYAAELRQSSPFVGYTTQEDRLDWVKRWKDTNSNT